MITGFNANRKPFFALPKNFCSRPSGPGSQATILASQKGDNLGKNEALALAVDGAVRASSQDDWRENFFKTLIRDERLACSAEIKCQARERHVSLRDFCQDEMLEAIVFAEFETLKQEPAQCFDIEATVTVATATELKVTADWPIRWLETAEGFEIQRKVVSKEILPEFDGTVKRLEIAGNRALWPNLCVGDDVIVRCFIEGE